ncbi:hypothetical protein CIP107538_02259 [Corynebacterium diphtheriae]|nr:hypothetical protein CIP107538_02259 [Corynebacterium diphtheriae]CAB0736603.1 hypothetical protein FRC0087_01959 [Corynebacterium diphtheriae]CAB0917324.1 hypothetical protein FRC0410_02027 [Corynebacterium diphtheriae]
MGADPLGRGKEWVWGVWRPFNPVGVLNDAAAAVNAATPAEAEALTKELDKIDP